MTFDFACRPCPKQTSISRHLHCATILVNGELFELEIGISHGRHKIQGTRMWSAKRVPRTLFLDPCTLIPVSFLTSLLLRLRSLINQQNLFQEIYSKP